MAAFITHADMRIALKRLKNHGLFRLISPSCMGKQAETTGGWNTKALKSEKTLTISRVFTWPTHRCCQ